MSTRTTLWAALAVVSAFAIAPVEAPAQMPPAPYGTRKDIDTTFFFSKIGTVLLGNGAATIIVTGWDQSSIQVKAHSDDGGLRLEATSSRMILETSSLKDNAVIKVMVPRGVRVVARSNTGSITVKDNQGDVEAESSSGNVIIVGARDVEATSLSGDLEVRQISGSTNLSSNNGDCTVMETKGSIDVSSVSGDVRVSKSWSKMVRAETTNGTVSFDGEVLPDGRYTFMAHSGSIWIALSKMADTQVGVTTWSGKVQSEFPIMLRPGFSAPGSETGTKRYTFTLGQGSARITAETFSGDVSITSSGGK